MVVFVRLPMFVEVKSVDSSVCGTRWDAGRTQSRRNGVKGCCAEEESVDKVEWEDKVEKVEKQECSVEVARR